MSRGHHGAPRCHRSNDQHDRRDPREPERPAKVIVPILTDGLQNASQEFKQCPVPMDDIRARSREYPKKLDLDWIPTS